MSVLFEKKWPSVILSPISIANYIVTVSDTFGLHPKQKITLQITGQPTKEFKINRILSRTQLQIGSTNESIGTPSDPTQYDGGLLCAEEQNRNEINLQATERAVYAEEPTVAIRSNLVDYYGNQLGTQGNPIVTTATTTEEAWDKILLAYNTNDDLINVQYYYQSSLTKQLNLIYDSDDNLTEVDKA